MTLGEAVIALNKSDDETGEEALDLSGFEAPSQKPATPPALTALYRLRAAALQMIAKENAREHAAAYERLRLDKELQQSTNFDWTAVHRHQATLAHAAGRTPDPSRIAWEDDETYFVW